MKKFKIFLNALLICTIVFALLSTILLVPTFQYWYDVYESTKSFLFENKTALSSADIEYYSSVQAIYFGYALRDLFTMIFSALSAAISAIILVIINLKKDFILSLPSISEIKSNMKAKKSERKETKRRAKISKLENELNDLKEGE